jgi:hypothetical protein
MKHALPHKGQGETVDKKKDGSRLRRALSTRVVRWSNGFRALKDFVP